MDGSGRRVLIVGTDEEMQAALGALVRTAVPGTDVATETDGEQAMRRAQAEGFALVVAEAELPSLPGPEFARRLAAAAPGIPLILLAPIGQRSLREQMAGMATVAAVFRRPPDPDDLAAAIRQALRVE